ncbi:MAG TPA: dihydrofolate reductase family protein [Pseudonocardiaceae bacterium]|nr:dihydrofolate reductase family protein [Pseudonocardiaceae bacterium]
MRKILVFLVASVDGYYEGPGGAFDWPVVDAEFNDFAVKQLDSADLMVFGRRTYEGMVAFWPTEEARTADPEVAIRMNGMAKIVASRTLESADWENTRLVTDDIAGELATLKRQDGANIIVMGSSNLATELLAAGLVDELRIMVMPIVLGGGKSLLHTVTGRVPVTLLDAKPFKSGNVLLTYAPGDVRR